MNKKRPILRYYGGKWNLAPWIIKHFPKHIHYIEPFGGAASVLLQKPRSKKETYNDIDENIYNFFRVLRNRKDELKEQLKYTPWSRKEFEMCLEPREDELEKARRFYVVCWMSVQGQLNTTKGQVRFDVEENKNAGSFFNCENLDWVVERLRGVQIENLDVFKLIPKYDRPNNLFYLDPPYVGETRTLAKVYTQEWDEHEKLSEVLKQIGGYAVLSGYKSELYEELYSDWVRFDSKPALGQSGSLRVESLWLSPKTAKALKMPVNIKLF